jgi:hypothetical protein
MGGRAGGGLQHKRRPDKPEFADKYQPGNTKFSNKYDDNTDYYDHHAARVDAIDQFCSVKLDRDPEFNDIE